MAVLSAAVGLGGSSVRVRRDGLGAGLVVLPPSTLTVGWGVVTWIFFEGVWLGVLVVLLSVCDVAS